LNKNKNKNKNMDVKNMDENMKAEIKKSATYISMTAEEAMSKFEEICSENNIETTNPIAKGLWRNFVANVRRTQNSEGSEQKSNDSFYKAAFGFFVSLDAPRDMMAWNRMKAKEEFMRDSDNALEQGIVAIASQNALGKWVVSRYHNGEYGEKTVSTLPSGAEETEDGRFYIPLDNTATYMNGGKNNNYGKPLPAEQMRRSGIFFGSVGATEEMKPYYFSYKNQQGVNFAPNTFEWVHFLCVANDNGTDIYGAKDLTLQSLSLNSEMNPENELYRDMSSFDFEDCLRENFESHLMTPTKNGNRIINLTDLNAEMDYDSDESGITTCWIPEHLTLDFGIGSSVIVIGRTSQRTTDEGVEPTTINVAGIYCTVRHGSAVEVSVPVEEDFDWF
jgi:hypothetical protein